MSWRRCKKKSKSTARLRREILGTWAFKISTAWTISKGLAALTNKPFSMVTARPPWLNAMSSNVACWWSWICSVNRLGAVLVRGARYWVAVSSPTRAANAAVTEASLRCAYVCRRLNTTEPRKRTRKFIAFVIDCTRQWKTRFTQPLPGASSKAVWSNCRPMWMSSWTFIIDGEPIQVNTVSVKHRSRSFGTAKSWRDKSHWVEHR